MTAVEVVQCFKTFNELSNKTKNQVSFLVTNHVLVLRDNFIDFFILMCDSDFLLEHFTRTFDVDLFALAYARLLFETSVNVPCVRSSGLFPSSLLMRCWL